MVVGDIVIVIGTIDGDICSAFVDVGATHILVAAAFEASFHKTAVRTCRHNAALDAIVGVAVLGYDVTHAIWLVIDHRTSGSFDGADPAPGIEGCLSTFVGDHFG